MKQFCFSSYMQLIKSHAKDKKDSNEYIVGEMFWSVCVVCGLERKTKDDYFSSKELASQLINRKEDIPKKVRNGLMNYELDRLVYGLEGYFNDILNEGERIHLYNELKSLYFNDPSVFETDKNQLRQSNYDGNTLLTYLLTRTAYVNNKVTEIKHEIFNESGVIVNYLYDDLMALSFNAKYKNTKRIVVIPVNTDFDTEVEEFGTNFDNPLVASDTIHGKWLNKMFELGYDSDLISSEIDSYRDDEVDVGAIVTIKHDNVMFYLLAISKFDENNNAKSTKEDIEKSLLKLIDFYNKKGQGVEMYIPLLGTNRSRAKLNHFASFRLLKDTFVTNADKYVGTINIVIYEKDRKKVEDKINDLP